MVERVCCCLFNPLRGWRVRGNSYHGLKPVATDVHPFGMDRGRGADFPEWDIVMGLARSGTGCLIVHGRDARATCRISMLRVRHRGATVEIPPEAGVAAVQRPSLVRGID